MKPSSKNKLAGKVHEAKGEIKKKMGKFTNNPKLEAEGISEKIAGKIQTGVGRVEKVVERAVK